MQKHRNLTQQRIQRFASDQQLGAKIYKDRHPVKLSSYAAPGRIPFETALQGLMSHRGRAPIWTDLVHPLGRVEIEIPAGWKDQEVHLLWDSTSEACVWDMKGQPLQGLTGSGNSWVSGSIRPEYRLVKKLMGEKKLRVYIEVACNGLFGNSFNTSDINLTGYLRKAEIAIFDPQAWDLLWDFQVIADMAEHLPADSPRGGQALYAANAMINAIDLEDPSTWENGRQIAADFFAAHNGDSQHQLSAVGHAHIDTAWLWPLGRNHAEMCTNLLYGRSLHGRLPRLYFCLLPGPTIRMDERTTSGPIREDKNQSKQGVLSPRAAHGLNQTPICPRGNPWSASSCLDKDTSRQSLGSPARNFGYRMFLAILLPFPRSCSRPESVISLPKKCPGTNSTNFPATPSYGKDWTAARYSPISLQWIPTIQWPMLRISC